MDKCGMRKGIVFVFLLLFTFTYSFPNPKQPSEGIPMLPFLPVCLLQGTPALQKKAPDSRRSHVMSEHLASGPFTQKRRNLSDEWVKPFTSCPRTTYRQQSRIQKKASLLTFSHYLQISISKLKKICCKTLETHACHDSFAQPLQENSVGFYLCQEQWYS